MCERHETENYISAFICNWLVAMFHLCQLSCQCIPPQHEVWRWRGAGVTLFLLGGQQLVTTGPEPGKMGNNKQWAHFFAPISCLLLFFCRVKKQSRAKFLTSWVRLRSEPNNEKDAFLLFGGWPVAPNWLAKCVCALCPHQTVDSGAVKQGADQWSLWDLHDIILASDTGVPPKGARVALAFGPSWHSKIKIHLISQEGI